jgi:nicotinamide-nucleotide amidase
MTDTKTIDTLAAALVSELSAARQTIALAESCTGGWIAKSLTDIPGSSACLGYGVVSYSNGAKETLLHVPAAILDKHGAVSEAVVLAMAEGVLNLSGADMSIAVSGIAGPDGGSEEKPVGTVWFAWARRGKSRTRCEAVCHRLRGDREQVRSQSVVLALAGARERLRSNG